VWAIGIDLGRYPFANPKIEMRIFENIETTSKTKTKKLNTTRNTTMKTVISIIYTL